MRIACPNCRKELKISDPSLLGRKAKCPACGHRFLLSPAEASETLIHETETVPRPPRTEPPAANPPPASNPLAEGSLPSISTAVEGGVGRLRELQRRNRQRRNRTLLVSAVFLLLLAGGFVLLRPHLPAPAPVPGDLAPTAVHAPPRAPQPGSDARPPAADWVDELSPTHGEPIELKMVPSGVRLIVNLRPAQLWSDDPQMAELRASLTQDVTGWLESQLKAVCRHDPSQIEEVLLAWILGARGTEPQLAAVVHLVRDARMSDLLDEFGSEAIDEFAQPKVYTKGGSATLILDTRTFATVPLEYGTELSDWVDASNYNTSDGILQLLPHTDRQRLVTVVFEPADMQRHLQALVVESARPALSRVAEWFASQAETVAWSLHTGEQFHSEILLNGPRTTSAITVEENVKRQMEKLPHTMVDLVRQMRPQRVGFRKLIGRFPAMLEVSRRATISSLEGHAVRLLTVMPPKAAPNLALASVLTWDESTRTDFSAAAAATLAAAKSQLPETVIGRLELPVDAEFNRVPLEEALQYIGGEIHVDVEIDGDALKDAGFTKNMAQTFDLGKVPASRTLAHLIGQYSEPGKQMVVVIDEARKMLIVSTKKFADQQGLAVHDFGS